MCGARGLISILFILLLTSESAFAFIRALQDVDPKEEAKFFAILVEDLRRISGLNLELRNGFIRISTEKNPGITDPVLPLLVTFRNDITAPNFSKTSRELLLKAIEGNDVHRVRFSSDARLGRVTKQNYIELDQIDARHFVFRGLPREAFSIGMTLLHELAHKFLSLRDPAFDEIEKDGDAKGDVVRYVNQIEHELGLPERAHYFPKKVILQGVTRYCIYFGNGDKRIEINPKFFQ